MIVKPLKPQLILLQTEALNKRLPPNHKMKDTVQNDARILRAGYNGERTLSFTLSLIDNPSIKILHNLRIPDSYGYFQIDNMIINCHYAVLSEVKNIYGTVTFDNMGQMIRSIGEEEEGFRNPIEQVGKQEYRLKKWLKEMRLPLFPIERFVVFSNSGTILRNLTNEKSLSNIVIHEDRLFSKLARLESKYEEASLTTRQLNRIIKRLLVAHTPKSVNILEKYEITKEQLIKGVFCEKCNAAIMIRIYGAWKCLDCGFTSKDAHITALKDYALLVSKEIGNREIREFLKVDSIHVAKHLMKKSGFKQSGVTSARKYLLDFDFNAD
ncbi:nuclease-related domain-containing protein [Ornithinibacillus halotolerans]|uniref:NERD domain-containing protein n=1 Tax=Ornithinibacillus halotolerans TaxID=1274357 RepID=A0A916WAK3_9BACI|nr:nuclease-related domain-containing protein [Ornithinibacillus halotolerans]GGA80790.1 hypothetical protein GCM10008025_25210 [Ornithinibacillus halotolerans]